MDKVLYDTFSITKPGTDDSKLDIGFFLNSKNDHIDGIIYVASDPLLEFESLDSTLEFYSRSLQLKQATDLFSH